MEERYQYLVDDFAVGIMYLAEGEGVVGTLMQWLAVYGGEDA